MMLFGQSDRFLVQLGRTTVVAFLLATALALIAMPVQAAIRYVDLNGVNGGNCLTPATACDSIADAITAAANGDELRVAKGTYTEAQITVNKGVTITGGYDPANPSTLWETTTYTSTPTILDGQNTNRPLYISSDNAVLQYLTVRNGNANSAATFIHFGGGILVAGAENVILRGLTVHHNVASASNANSTGGGIAVVGNSEVEIERTLILSNTTPALGGGIGVRPGPGDSAIVNVRSSVIAHNAALEGGALATGGGGSSFVTFYHTTFGDNNQGTPGADEAVFMTGGSAATSNSLNFSYSLLTGNNTAVRVNLNRQLSILSTGLMIDTNVSDDWVGPDFPAILPADQRALLFVNPAAADYHLAALSPAIDLAGNTLRTDLEGRTRVSSANCTPFSLCPLGRADDLGAYEFVYSAPVVRYVATEGEKERNCLDPNLPCGTLEDANLLALGGDEIRVAQGSYSGGDSACANAAVICIRQGITLTGGFTLTNWTTPSIDSLLTVIDGTNLRRGIMVDYDVASASSRVQNLTVRNGNTLSDGAGIAVNTQNIGPAQNLAIRNCRLENNQTTGDGDGGGLYANDPVNLSIENCVMANNRVLDGRGGGLAITDDNGDATYTLTTLIIYGNLADRPDENSANGGRGGGVFLEGKGTLRQSEVYSNSATFTGGGVSTGSNDANPTIDRVFIHDNQASVGGGFSIFLTGGAKLQNSLLVRNVATSTVPLTGQMTEIVGGNAIHAPEGGAPGKPLLVTNVTIADNDGAVPEAVKLEGSADINNTRTHTFTNVLISGNEVGIVSDGNAVATLVKVSITNDVTTKIEGFANDRLSGAPLDGVAGFVGGGDYRLLPGADGVDDGDTVPGITQDLDGVNRPVGPAFDIGAYETTLAPPETLHMPLLKKQ